MKIFHHDDWDGYGSAWVARKVYPSATFIVINYTNPVKTIKDNIPTLEDVIFLDFNPCRFIDIDTLRAMTTSLLVIDHHKTSLGDAIYPECLIDIGDRCGAVLAWGHFFPSEPVPTVLKYINDMDVWVWREPHTHEIFALIDSYKLSIDSVEEIHKRLAKHPRFMAAVDFGQILMQNRETVIDNILRHTQFLSMFGYDRIPTVNSSCYQSFIGHEMCERYPDAPFVVIWYVGSEGTKHYSLRSVEGGADVSVIAKSQGGGGHIHAAGFEVRRTLH